MTLYKLQLLSLFLTVVGASPLYIGTPLSLEHGYSGANLHHLTQASALVTQPLSLLYQYGNLDQLGTLAKGLLSSHLGGQVSKGLQLPLVNSIAALTFASPELQRVSPISSYPLKKEMLFPEKKIAGALVKQVPTVSKLPISLSYSPQSLGFSTIAQSGVLEGGLSGGSILPGKSFINPLGLSYGF